MLSAISKITCEAKLTKKYFPNTLCKKFGHSKLGDLILFSKITKLIWFELARVKRLDRHQGISLTGVADKLEEIKSDDES